MFLKSLSNPENLKKQKLTDVLIFICALIFYYFSLHNGVGGRILTGNAIKFQYTGWIPGIPHSPGFPLYTMISWLWSHLPIPVSVAWKTNFLSAVFSSLSLVFFRRGLQKIGVSFVVAVVTVIGLALSESFWMRATEAGPVALSFFLCTALFLCIINWLKNHEPLYLYSAFFILFLLAGNDLTFQWLAPVIILFLIIEKPGIWARAKTWVAFAFAVLLGAGVFGYIYARSHQSLPNLEFIRHNASVKNIFYFALGEQFWPNYFFADQNIIFGIRIPDLWIDLAKQFHFTGLIFIVTGAFAVWKKSIRIALFGFICAAISVVAVIHLYSPILKFQYWIFFLIAAYSCGVGLDFLCKAGSFVKVLLISMYLLSVFSYAYVHNRQLFNKYNKYDVEELLMAFPQKKGVCVVDDIYTWQEVLRYYETTNPFIKKRKIKLSDSIESGSKNHHLFFLDTVKSNLDIYGIAYLPVCTNENKVLYLLGSRVSHEGEN